MTSANLKALRDPFPSSQVSWRVGVVNQDKTRGQALPHLDARNIQNRLDEVIGPESWRPRFQEVIVNGKLLAVRCILGIKLGDEWVEKEDAANFDNSEFAIKGVYSDALKRAAVQWGIGRYLYAFQAPWVSLDEHGRLTEIPSLPQEMLPEGETAQAPTPSQTQAVAPADKPVTAAPAEAKVTVQEVSAEKTTVANPEKASATQQVLAPAANDDSRKDAADAVVDKSLSAKTATAAPAAEPPAKAASTPAQANQLNPEDPQLPADITEEQLGLVKDLEVKMTKLPAAMIRSYINGPKGQEKLSAACREYLLAKLAKQQGAAEAA